MLFTASAAKRQHPIVAATAADELEPSLFRRKMESASTLPAAPPAAMPAGRPTSVVSRIPAPSVRQYLFNLSGESRRLTEAEVRNAVVGVTPVEVESVARAVARLRGEKAAQAEEAAGLAALHARCDHLAQEFRRALGAPGAEDS